MARTLNISPVATDGYQYVRVAGAVAADDPWLISGDDKRRYRFEVITSGVESLNLKRLVARVSLISLGTGRLRHLARFQYLPVDLA